jgi:hypothetical protein
MISSGENEDSCTFENIINDELTKQETERLPGKDCGSEKECIQEDVLSKIERNNYMVQKSFVDAGTVDSSLSITEQLKKYKEDQLLSKPGGDYFETANGKGIDAIDYNKDLSQFTTRVGKDLKDAGDNFVNIIKDMGIGAKSNYIDNDGNITSTQKVGFLGTIINFFKDFVSGVSFGKYAQEGENKPDNTFEATKHFFKKIFVDALFKDIIVGVPRSFIHIGEDTVFTCLNLVETIPDATIGNFKTGQKITTEIFDDTQVFVDFVTDVLPMGEAGSRTHAFAFNEGLKGLPFVYNLTSPEQGKTGDDWKYVRNTPFRKAIETVATIIPVRM